QPSGRRHVAERVEAQKADRRLRGWIVAQPHAAEAPGVAKDDFPAVVEREVQLEESRRPRLLARPTALDHEPPALPAARPPPAGHAEVKAGPGTLVELEPEVLAMAMGRDHPAPDEPAPDSRRAHTLEHDRVGRDTDGDDAPADGGSRQQAA